MLSRVFACLLLIAAALPAFAQDEGDPNEVVARVDGAEVTRDDVVTAIMALPPEYQQVPMEILFEPILQQVIDRKLLAEAGKEAGYEDSDAYERQMALLREELLQQMYLQAAVDEGLTEDALNAAYEAYVESFKASGEGDEVHARHILVNTEDEAQAVIDRLNAGEDFAALAQELSIGPSGPDGGDLGFFKKADMVPEFAEAAFALQPGETSGPVQSPFGWHVIQVEERRQAEPPPIEQVASQLSNQIAQEIVGQKIEALRADADIEILLPEPPAEPEANMESDGDSDADSDSDDSEN